MRGGGFFEPIAAALALVPRWPSILVWALLVAIAAGGRAASTAVASSTDVAQLVLFNLSLALAPTLLGGVLAFLLARALLGTSTGDARPLYGRFLGLVVASSLLVWFIHAAGSLAIFANDPSPFMTSYGPVLVGSVGSVAVFPLLIRMMATAVGADQPRLGGIVAFLCGEGRFAYAWCAFCAIVFPMLMVLAFSSLPGTGNAANALPGNLVQSAITSTGSLLRFLLAIVVLQRTIPTAQRQAEVFA